ncbi:trimethylamine methyltransferase family protein [Aliisedimentitalea scapharcae]|uniref:Methyltransferase n=1 Tax=Aliisedimentitalea scapharcae TaxID=1524259 RepID=A0ABZ2XQG7_9RHOB
MAGRSGRRGREARIESNANPGNEKPPVWGGLTGGAFRPLSDDNLAEVNEAVLMLLETLGLSQATPSMIEKVCAHGGTYTDDKRLLFPRDLVLKTVAEARRDVVLYGQDRKHDLDLSGARVHMSSGGGAPGVFDIDDGHYRDGSLKDLYDAARICDAMENIHHFSRSIVARDVENVADMDLNTAYACLMGTSKHVSVSVSEPENLQQLADLCYTLAGSEDAFRARPFLTVMVCHVVPPMRFAEEALDTLEAAILAGFPVQLISAGQAGATSPATIAGSLVQAVAETLAGLVFARLIDPNVAALFGPKPLVADLRTGSMCAGGGEQAILMAGAAQMGRYYNLPTTSIAGISDSKTLDAQYGSEKNLAVSSAAHAGSNLITQSCGMQASLLGVSLEAYVVDNDMLGNILRTVRGIEVNAENIGAEVIADVCRGEGHYLGHRHTFSRMKSDYFYPHLGDRRTPREWEEDGSRPIGDTARDKARELLASHFPAHISNEKDAELRDRFNICLSFAQIGRG